MSAVDITTKALLADGPVTAITSTRVNPGMFPQGGTYPAIAVHLIAEADEYLMAGAGQYYESRVSIECVATSYTVCATLATAVIAALQDQHLAALAGRTATFFKETTDVTDYTDETEVHRRIMDFRVRWR